jgi:hypothetical protein
MKKEKKGLGPFLFLNKNSTPCNIPLVPFNTRTATLFFRTHQFEIRHV